ncbi:hypothetical protein RYX36_005874 [Vicia faba]
MHDLCLDNMRLMSLLFFFWLLLVLILFFFKNSISVEGYAKSQNFRTDSNSKLSAVQGKTTSTKNSGVQGSEDVLADEKRKIYTGPNPLHNR